MCLVSFTYSHLFLSPRLTNGSSALGHLKAIGLLETRRGCRSDPCGLFGVVAATLGTCKRFFDFLSTAAALRRPFTHPPCAPTNRLGGADGVQEAARWHQASASNQFGASRVAFYARLPLGKPCGATLDQPVGGSIKPRSCEATILEVERSPKLEGC